MIRSVDPGSFHTTVTGASVTDNLRRRKKCIILRNYRVTQELCAEQLRPLALRRPLNTLFVGSLWKTGALSFYKEIKETIENG